MRNSPCPNPFYGLGHAGHMPERPCPNTKLAELGPRRFSGSGSSDPVGRAAVMRGFGPVGHAVIAHDARYAEAVIGKHARAPARLRLAVAREVTPAPHCFLVAPERKRQELVFVREAREALHRDEPVDFLELGPQLSGELQILLFPARSRNDLEYHGKHLSSFAIGSGRARRA